MKNLKDMTDEELALSYVDGNNKAFDLLLSRNQQNLFSYILFVVHDRETADDIFQETFIKVITRLQEGRYVVSGKFGAWVMRIAHNAIMDWYRDQSSRCIVKAGKDNDLSNIGGDDLVEGNIENTYVNRQVMSDVRRLLDMLPPHSARGGVHALLPAALVQGDCRHHEREHQHRTRTHALRPAQHATHGEEQRHLVAAGVNVQNTLYRLIL